MHRAPAVRTGARPAAPRVLDVVAGDDTTCIRTDDGLVRCRGRLAFAAGALPGALEVTDLAVCARGGGVRRCRRPGVDRAVPTAFVEVAAGAGARVGRDPSGGVWAFRDDEAGAALVAVPVPAPAVAIAADAERSCALLDDARLVCWDGYRALTAPPPIQPRRHGRAGGHLVVPAHLLAHRRGRHLLGARRSALGRRHRRRHRARRRPGARLRARPRRPAVVLGRGRRAARAGDGAARHAVGGHRPHLRPVARGAAVCWGRDDAGQAAGPWP
ncbi:MAG: hypothetical protein R3F59_08930 [Myxococcota bacterium]